jgi:MarR family transcriptional regulator, 2-MHQ and catechol-resistance regulon repressor
VQLLYLETIARATVFGTIQPMADPLEHPHLTTIGLFMEAHAGLAAALERELEAHSGLSAQWFEVLIRLARTPGHRLRMTDLAAQTTLSASGLTRAVDRLEAAGLVAREACPSDRRSTYAVLTDAGEARIVAALPLHVSQVVDVLDAVFTPRELATFTDLTRRLRDAANPCAAKASEAGGLEGDAA